MKGKFCIWFTAIVLVCIGCTAEEVVIDPREAILGKWEITHLGNGDQLTQIVNPISYQEYFKDSLMRVYNYEEGDYDYEYWMNDSILSQRRAWIAFDGVYYDTIVVTQEYLYEFLDANMIRFNIINMTAWNYTSIYHRIDN